MGTVEPVEKTSSGLIRVIRNVIGYITRLISRKQSTVPVQAPEYKRIRKTLVIDDTSFIGSSIKQLLRDDQVDILYRLPSDMSTLDYYDVLIVDNQGIGNSLYKSGQEFLTDYVPKRKGQIVVYFSGLEPDREFLDILIAKGFYNHTKGRDPQKLVMMIDSAYRLKKLEMDL